LHLISRLLILVLVTLFVAAEPLQETSARRLSRGPNTWSARSPSGVALQGTWTAVIDATSGAVTGTWTLDGPNKTIAARGTWSAAKSSAGWTGAWRAIRAPSTTEYSGSWSTTVDLPSDASLGSLFEMATQHLVSGQWRVARQSGGWSIRAFD
jgi:hypothetical protein